MSAEIQCPAGCGPMDYKSKRNLKIRIFDPLGYAMIGKPKSGKSCQRCGRTGHTRSKCYATTTVDGVAITTHSWKYRPKTKAKAKPKTKAKAKKSRCKGRTLYGTGPRCKLTAAKGSDYCRVHAPYYPKKKRSRR